MRSLTCPGCGCEFTAYAARQRFCGDECAKEAKRARGRAGHAARMASPKAWCSYEGCCDKPVFNRGLCNGHNEQRRKGQKLRPLRPRVIGRIPEPKRPRVRVCPRCDSQFELSPGTHGDRTYCTPECATQAKRDRDREHQKTYRLTRPPCEFKGCDNLIASGTLCAGHKAQERAGKPLTPLRGSQPWAASSARPLQPKPKRTAKRLRVAVTQDKQPTLPFLAHPWLLSPGDRSRPRGTPCPFMECGRPIFCRGLCAGHYSQATDGRELTPLRRQRRWHEPRAQCAFPRCGDPVHSMTLCMRHDSQRRKTSIPVGQYVAFATSLDGHCSYCTEGLVGKFEIDHAHDGNCGDGHRDEFMCTDCIRGFVHRQCNEELKWLERAMCAGRVARPAPDVARYLAARPFQEQTRG